MNILRMGSLCVIPSICLLLSGCEKPGSGELLESGTYYWSSGEGTQRSRVGLFTQLDGIPGHITFLSGGRVVVGDNRQVEAAPGREDFNTLILEASTPADVSSGTLYLRAESESSGNARLRFQQLYPEINHWWRDLFWEPEEMRIEDQVTFQLGKRSPLAFTWNLGYRQPVEIQGEGRRYIVEGETYALVIEGDHPLSVTLSQSETGSGLPQLWVQPEPGYSSYKVITRILPRRRD